MPQGSRAHKFMAEMFFFCYIFVFISLATDRGELHADFWNTKARQALFTAINVQPNTRKAKNMILFIGDGESEQHLSCKWHHYFLVLPGSLHEKKPERLKNMLLIYTVKNTLNK